MPFSCACMQMLLQSNKDKDITGHVMPNLIYVSREKRPKSPHHFKAGALNALVRPIITASIWVC